MRDEGGHAVCVERWLAEGGQGLSDPEFLRLFEEALRALWDRTTTTLGTVTLTAIVDRVFFTAAERFPAFVPLKVDPKDGIRCGPALRRIGATEVDPHLRAAAMFVLVELLSLLGNLTAEILTKDLHEELQAVTLQRPVLAGPAPAVPASPVSAPQGGPSPVEEVKGGGKRS